MLRFSLLGSGSKGNATLVECEGARILVDCGFSLRQLVLRAQQVGGTLDGLDAVLITHEHIDHVHGLGVLARKLGAPIYMTAGTRANLPAKVGAFSGDKIIEAGETFQVKGMSISSFSVAHDAADPVSFTLQAGGAKLGFATDLGHGSQLVRARLAGCNALVLESNYCPEMLRAGSYPPQVQQRIRSRMGHLSNQDMTVLLTELLHEKLQTIVLYHISENNNCYDLARRLATQAVAGHPAQVVVASQSSPTGFIEVRP